ncbi:inner nuclear membrane protein enriched at telomere/subtelomere region [Basidiobolus ranarum]|uniref:Inner nuclear membrane protein enriched at telomere/subtelomere region n=1 Tax=Basidiobolus ranarum TaxID=34480 RepID=A0ABR2VUM4_9FUNG
MEDFSYLEPNFDPNSLRVVDLRRILMRHNIPFNANNKKAALVELFDSHVVPNATTWKQEITNANASNRGMIYMGFDKDPESLSTSLTQSALKSQGHVRSAVEKFELLSSDGELSPPPSQSSTSRRKIKTKSATDKSDPFSSERESLSLLGDQTSSHTPSVDDPGFSSDDLSAVSNHNSQAKSEDLKIKSKTLSKIDWSPEEQKIPDVDVFSDDNPFQSGGETPNTRKKKRTKVRKLKSEFPETSLLNVETTSETETIPTAEILHPELPEKPDPSPRKFMSPSISRVSAEPKLKKEPSVIIDKPKRRTRRRRYHRNETRVEYEWGSLWVFLTVVLAVYLFWLRQKNLLIGYCEPNEQNADLQDSKISIFYPQCTPCPPHATLRVKCVPDPLKLARIDLAVELAKSILDQQAGKAECDTRSHVRAEITEIDLKKLIQNDPNLQNIDTEEIWPSVLSNLIEQRQHIEFHTDENQRLYFLSHEPEYPIQCRLRKGLYSFLIDNLQEITIGLLLLFGGVYGLTKYNSYRNEKELIRDLVQRVLLRLAEQENLHYVDPVQYPSGAVSAVQLRDVLLRSMHNHIRRKYIWDKVRKVVETNSNIRSGVTEIRGEPHRVWEWVGPSISPVTSPNQRSNLYPAVRQDQDFMSDEGMFSDD